MRPHETKVLEVGKSFRSWRSGRSWRDPFNQNSGPTGESVASHANVLEPVRTSAWEARKSGPPQKVDPFFRNLSGWTEPIHWVLDRIFRKFWLNGSRPMNPSLRKNPFLLALRSWGFSQMNPSRSGMLWLCPLTEFCLKYSWMGSYLDLMRFWKLFVLLSRLLIMDR